MGRIESYGAACGRLSDRFPGETKVARSFAPPVEVSNFDGAERSVAVLNGRYHGLAARTLVGIGRYRSRSVMTKGVRSWKGAFHRPQTAVPLGKRTHNRRALRPKTCRRPAPFRHGGRLRRCDRLDREGEGAIGFVDQMVLAQVIEHSLPVPIAEGMDDKAVTLQQERHRTVAATMPRRWNTGSSAAVIEIATESLHDGFQ